MDTDTGEVNDTVDFVTPPSVRLGYRGKFHQWGLDAYGRLSFGTTERALHRNDAVGHADFKTSVALGLQFLSYTDPSGIASAYYGLEVFQLTGSLGGRVFTLPGLALRLRREIDSFHLGLRISGAHILSDTSRDELTFRSRITTVAEAAWFAAPLANVSWYVGAHAGLEIQRFEGPATFLDPGTTATESTEVVTLGVRGGVELFRSTDMRADLHAELDLPTWPAKDRDAGVVDEWVPTLSIGVGVAF